MEQGGTQSTTTLLNTRRPSRHSSNNLCNIDFDFYGNSSSIHHLLQPRVAGPGGQDTTVHPVTLTQLQFEVGLRHYTTSKGGIQTNQPWSKSISTKSLGKKVSKNAIAPTVNKYNDKFKHVNDIRHILNDSSQNLQTKQWSTNLRDYTKTEKKKNDD